MIETLRIEGLAIVEAPPTPAPVEVDAGRQASASQITARAVRVDGDVGRGAPEPGTYRIHLFDVGLGLAVLVQGHDFSLLYDGGSADDLPGNRLLDYLVLVLGDSGELTHLVLSHPHQDHTNFLDEVLERYAVSHVWDVGVVSHSAFYEAFVRAVAAESGVRYHTVAPVPEGRTVRVRGARVSVPDTVRWSTFAEGHLEALGRGASMTVLHANADAHDDFNDNSLVLRMDLGATSLLLTGDAESGPRRPPDSALAGIEAHLVDRHREAIDVDVWLVNDHGSMAANRLAFLQAVSPTWALLSAGPRRYGRIGYPDSVVVDAVLAQLAVVEHALPAEERFLRTDENDRGGCPVDDRIGPDDSRPGGCDGFVLSIR